MAARFAALSLAPLVLGLATAPSTRGTWYDSLAKPSWQPPRWLFGPVWTMLYILMGVASALVWAKAGWSLPIQLYVAQLVLNYLWSWLFFVKHDLTLASVEILALLAVLVATTAQFWGVDATAGKMMVPYLIWVSFATVLTLTIKAKNPSK